MAKQTIIREKPTISIITLSRYITADSKKKETLLKKIKFSDPPLFTRYSSPKSAINHYLKDQHRSLNIFDKFIEIEKVRVLDSDFKKSDNHCCLEALEILKIKSANLFSLYNNHFSKKGLNKQFTHLFIEGVDVSLSPDYAIYNRLTKKIEGFIKLNFSKDRKQRLTYTQGQLIAGLIKDHLEAQFETKFDRKLCVALDVFANKLIYAPEDQTWQRDRPKLKAAYKEIATVWPFLQPKSA